MSSPEQYTPRDFSALDVLQAAKRTADAIMRANPLVNAVISHGLMVWKGNHLDSVGDRTDYLWIGDFLPADPTLGGIPQKGFVLRRDDSTSVVGQEGTMAFALYDHDPGGGGLGLRQTIHWRSVDQERLTEEARNGGLKFPQATIPMFEAITTDRTKWHTVNSTSFADAFEGVASCVGRDVYGRYWVETPGGVTGECRITASWPGGSTIGPTTAIGAATLFLNEETISVAGARGQTDLQVKLQVRVASGAGAIRVAPVSFRNFTVAA